jgi:pantoate--beta-alanine ligase
MVIFNEIAPLQAFLRAKKKDGKSIGLVPTMGALHGGHLSIIEASKAENNLTVCSIYVNPTQFNNPEDLVHYPRTLDKDTNALEKVECDVLFYPENREMYQGNSNLRFQFGHLEMVMEGKFRPGHFSGVALVVSKLFHIVEPDRAYFGQKDWQQFAVITQLVQELKFNIFLHCVPTLREKDGLAMSSRNLRLSPAQRTEALFFFNALSTAKKSFQQGASVEEVKRSINALANIQTGVRLEYFEVAESENLNLIENVKTATRPIMCIAGFVGDVRLIDNMFID